MKYTIDENVCEKYSLSFESLLLAILVKLGTDIESAFDSLLEREIIVETDGRYTVTQRWDDVMSSILLDSENSKSGDEEMESLARKLMEIFPKGKKEGTSMYWRGNVKDIKLRLKKFFKLYGGNYTEDQIINAAKAYVQSYNGNYSYMRILKYFIWKDERKVGSDGNMYIEEVSELASFIENEGQEENNEWTTNVL